MTWTAYLLMLFGASWALVGLFRAHAIDRGMLDHPSERSSHYAPTARGGGVVFFGAWMALIGVLYITDNVSLTLVKIFAPVGLVGAIGFWDDTRGASKVIRLLFQSVAALLFLWMVTEGVENVLVEKNIPVLLSLLATVLGIVWMTNLFNFMDGSDGMAAQEAMFVFGMGGYFLLQQGAVALGILALGLVALLAGFLTWNWPVARIFMGDSGSYFLGFTLSMYAIIGDCYCGIPLVIWFILTGLFWFDATVTLVRRILHQEKWSTPHRLHAYQRLIQHGWSHQAVLLCAIMANTVLAGLAWIAFYDPRLQSFSIGVGVVFLTALYLLVEMVKPMYSDWYGRKS